VKALRSLLIASLLAVATTASAQDWKFEAHGFVSSTLYYQDQAFGGGQGQSAIFFAPTPANEAGGSLAPATLKNGSLIGGDVRQSKITFSVTGPQVFMGATPKAVFEWDWFGSPAAGTFAAQGYSPRIREFYSELNWGSTQLTFGQRNSLLLIGAGGLNSMSHIGSPYAFGAGLIGFRQPGIRVTYGTPVGDGMKLTVAAEAMANRWNDAAGATSAGPGANSPTTVDRGEASGMPMFQGRAMFEAKTGPANWYVYLVGEYHSVDLKGFASVVPAGQNGKTSISGSIFQAGGKVIVPYVTVAANFYTGNAGGNQLGNFLQLGDIKTTAYFANLTINATKELSINGFYGNESLNKADVRSWIGNTGRLSNTDIAGQVKYQDGNYAIGLEYINIATTYSLTATTEHETKANQIGLTANYFF
jgi:hypothetical protein